MTQRYERGLIYALIITLPLWGYSLVNISGRGIRMDWVVCMFMGVFSLVKLFFLNKKIVKDSLLIYLFFLEFSLVLSASVPFLTGTGEMMIDYATLFLQFQLCFMAFFYVIHTPMDQWELKRVLMVFMVVGFVIAALGIVQLVASGCGWDLKLTFTNVGRNQPTSGYKKLTGMFSRATGFFSEPRQLGNYLAVRFSLLLAMTIVGYRLFKSKKLQVLVMIILGMGALSSLASSAYFVLAASVTSVSMLCLKKKHLKRVVLVTVIVILSLILLYLALGQEHALVKTLNSRFAFLKNLNKVAHHFVHMDQGDMGIFRYVGNYRFAIDTFLEYPLTGVGLNNLPHHSKYGLTVVHGPMSFVAQAGVAGALALFAFFAGFLWKFRRLRQKFTARFPQGSPLFKIGPLMIIIPLITSFGSDTHNIASTFFWCELSLAAAVYFHLKRKLAGPRHQTMNNDDEQ